MRDPRTSLPHRSHDLALAGARTGPLRVVDHSYLADVLDTLRAEGLDVGDEMTAHLTPAQHDHINFYGTYSFDLDTELSR